MVNRRYLIIHILSMLIAATITEVFLILSLAFFHENWGNALYLTALISGTIFNLALAVCEVVFYAFRKEVFYKACITGYVLVVFALVVLYLLLRTGFFEVMRDKDKLEDYLRRFGGWMGVFFIILQFLQVVVLPIPSFVTVAAGSALFGPLRSSLYSLLGIVLGSLVAFIIGRYVGYRAVAWLVGKDTLDKWLKKVKGKDKLLLSAMFLLPVFPDDLLCFVAGLSSMSLPFFLVVILISRVAAIFVTSYSVVLIPFNTWWGILIWVAFFILVAILFVILYKKADAIQNWFNKKIHRETRVRQDIKKDEFTVEIVDPNGAIVTKGVKKGENETDDLPKKRE